MKDAHKRSDIIILQSVSLCMRACMFAHACTHTHACTHIHTHTHSYFTVHRNSMCKQCFTSSPATHFDSSSIIEVGIIQKLMKDAHKRSDIIILQSVSLCVHACMHARTRAHTRTHARTRVRAHTHTHTPSLVHNLRHQIKIKTYSTR